MAEKKNRTEYNSRRWKRIKASETESERMKRLSKNGESVKAWYRKSDPRCVPGFYRFGLTGENNVHAKLTANQVLRIKRRYAKSRYWDDEDCNKVANEYGVCKSNIKNIIANRTWKWLNGKNDIARSEMAKAEREKRRS